MVAQHELAVPRSPRPAALQTTTVVPAVPYGLLAPRERLPPQATLPLMSLLCALQMLRAIKLAGRAWLRADCTGKQRQDMKVGRTNRVLSISIGSLEISHNARSGTLAAIFH